MGRQCCGRGSREEPPPAQPKERQYIPAEDMGDYEEYKKKKSPKKSGPLYPLNEEGSYGAPPAPLPKPLPGYQKRERKPKVYSGYAVSSDCHMHADKLIQNEQSRGQTVRRRSAPVPARRASTLPRSYQGARGPSPAPARSVRGPSPAPSVDSYGARPTDWKNSLRGSSVSREDPPRVRRKPSMKRESPPKQPSVERSPTPRSPTPERRPSPQRRSLSSDGQSHRSSTGSTDWGYTSYSSFLSGSKTSTTSLQSSQRSSTSSKTSSSNFRKSLTRDTLEEDDESYGTGKVSLDALKPAEISPWDNMGILGLTSKMFANQQQSFSASSFVRKESVSSHAM